MSLCTRTAAAATSRRLPSVSWTAAPSPLSARHVWLNATSLHSTAPSHLHLHHRSHPSSAPPIRRFSSTQSSPSPSPAAAAAADSSAGELAAVHSMAELREVVEQANVSSRLVILEWKATWCGKCKTVAKELQRLQAKHPNVLTVRTVDIEEGDLAEGKKEAGIDHIPVLHFIKGGELVHEIVGVRVNEMSKTVEKYAGEQSAASA